MKSNYLNYIQMALIFANGFLISRLFIKCGIAEKIVFFFIKKSKGKIQRIIIFIVFSAAIISMFIPNVITVLAFLPIINILRKDLISLDKKGYPLTTGLAISNLYGANIGGIGSVTGSASNAIIIAFLYFYNINTVNKINFISWLGWGFPLSMLLCTFGSFMIIKFMIPKSIKKQEINFNFLHEHKEKYAHQKLAIIISLGSFLFWLIISGVNLINPKIILPYTTVLALLFIILTLVIIFLIKFYDKNFDIKSRLLVIKDFYSDMPIKGFVIAGITFAISGVLIYFKVDKQIAPLLKHVLPDNPSKFLLMFIFAAFTVYLSEFVSNNVTAISFSFIALTVCRAANIEPFSIVMGISLVSTIPFMSPLANAVNALAYGGVKNVNLKKMMFLGLFMNMIGITIITVLSTYILPAYY